MSKENIDQLAYPLLKKICRYINPAQELKVTIAPGLQLQPGEFAIADGFAEGFLVGTSKDEATDVGNHIRSISGIRVEINVPNGYAGNCDATVKEIEPVEKIYHYVSPWFLDWYCRSTLIQPEIKSLVASLHHAASKRGHSWIYRGEDSEYPTVRSTLSRYWNTTDPDVIRTMEANNRNRLRNFAEEKTDQEMESLLQQLGGKSNLVDFSRLVWVALYFACEGELGNDGRIWGLDTSRKRQSLSVLYPDEIQEEVARQRLEKQLGVMVKSPSGIIDSGDLKKIETIPAVLKPKLLGFLENTIGISKRTLFPDIFAHIDSEQDWVSLESLIYMLRDWIKSGEIKRAWSVADYQVKNKENQLNKRGCMYYRGLAYAFLGDVDRAHKDIKTAREMFTDGAPGVLDKNLWFIKCALKSRDCSRLKKQLDLGIDEKFWSLTLSGMYRRVSKTD